MQRGIGMVGPVTNYASGQQMIPVTYNDIQQLIPYATLHCASHAKQYSEVRRLVGYCLLTTRQHLDEIGAFDEQYEIGNYEMMICAYAHCEAAINC